MILLKPIPPDDHDNTLQTIIPVSYRRTGHFGERTIFQGENQYIFHTMKKLIHTFRTCFCVSSPSETSFPNSINIFISTATNYFHSHIVETAK